MLTSEYLNLADTLLGIASKSGDPERAPAQIAAAQVHAIQALAAAVDRLAEVIEARQ